MRVSIERRSAFIAIRFIFFLLIAAAYTYLLPVVLLCNAGLYILANGMHLAKLLLVPFVFIGSALNDEGYYDRWIETWAQGRSDVATGVKDVFVEPFTMYSDLWRWVVDGPRPNS
jgi:hypothetical protein